MSTPEFPIDHEGSDKPEALVNRVGHLVRTLRTSLRELGLHNEIEKAAQAIPDARMRLNYVAEMTEQAAEKALNAVDRAQPLQDEIQSKADTIKRQWTEWLEASSNTAYGELLARETCVYMDEISEASKATNKELLEIMMAQDFQDLTGQVIKRMMTVFQDVESQLLDMLVDSVADEKERDDIRHKMSEQRSDFFSGEEDSLLNGPQIDPDQEDIVSSQDQVDDLLDELGF